MTTTPDFFIMPAEHVGVIHPDEDGNITILQPDLSKSGGITEVQRIAAAASMWKLPIHPHSSMTGLNHAVSIHFLASIDNGGYFEADLSVANKFRDELGSAPWHSKQQCLRCIKIRSCWPNSEFSQASRAPFAMFPDLRAISCPLWKRTIVGTP
mgnify:CR=1 FL=1